MGHNFINQRRVIEACPTLRSVVLRYPRCIIVVRFVRDIVGRLTFVVADMTGVRLIRGCYNDVLTSFVALVLVGVFPRTM